MNYNDAQEKWDNKIPDYEEKQNEDELSFTVSGDKENLVKFEAYLAKVAQDLGLELYL